ncbi:MAG: nicotinate-nucleotide--dimethylbenzimidazole phosphoribosyltransferase [Nitrospira sp. SB0667_bin_9]|nr:nicotinate-nucleotide--dimethylbenzimidazole phosphoribosyltransferase [Nitrospira sp. SB0667_bin_9]
MGNDNIDLSLPTVRLPDEDVRLQAQARLDFLTKPVGSLGRLEEVAANYLAITGSIFAPRLDAVVFTLAADHGVTTEGVSAYPQSVTAQMVKNFVHGGAAVNVLARHAEASLRLVDMGVAEDLSACAGLLDHKIAYGTKNFLCEPAMSREQALQSIQVGMDLAKTACADEKNLIAVGEMGIGNTTSSAAIVSVLTGQSVEKVTGRGTGVDDRTMKRKISVIEQALDLHHPSSSDAIEILTKVGGFEIGGTAGLMLGAAARRVPVVLDGFITGASALLAVALEPRCREYLIASHLSREPGHRIVLDHLRLDPLLDLQMRLGEGTGACLAVTLIHAALKIYKEMATFDEARVSSALQHHKEEPGCS